LVEANRARWAERDRAEGERLAKLEAQANEKLAGERLVQVEAEKKKADEEKQIAQAVRDFLQNKLLAQADTSAQANALLKAGESSSGWKLNPTIRELLDRAARELAPDRIAKSFPQPLIQAEILQTVGVAYREIDEYQPAIEFLKRSEALRRQHLGHEHPDTLAAMTALARAYGRTGKLDLALPLFEETLRLRKARLGPEHDDTLESMRALAANYTRARKHDLALSLYKETLELLKTRRGPEDIRTAGCMNDLAVAYGAAGKHELALPLFQEALKLSKARRGPEHPGTILGMSNLAWGYKHVGKLDLALPLFEETLRLRKAKLGSDHPDTLASLEDLAAAYRAARRLDLALPLLEERFKLQKARLGPEHPATLTSLNTVAMAYWGAKQLDKSIPLFAEALKRQQARLGRDHPSTILAVANLGVNYRDAGRLKEALPLLEEAHRAAKKYAKTANLRQKQLSEGRKAPPRDSPKPARLLLQNGMVLLRDAHAPNFPRLALGWVELQLLLAYEKTEDHAKIANLRQEQLSKGRKTLPRDSPELALLLAQNGLVLLLQKKWLEAEPLLRECLAIREKTQPDAWSTFNTKSSLGGALLGQKKYADAEPLLLAGYEGMKQREKTIPLPGKLRIPEAIERLVQLYEATGKKDAAAKWRKELAARTIE
jgi:tetratricopeptide (TPR) repeat protein